MTTTDAAPASRTRATLAITAGVIAALVIVFFIFASLYTDFLWFDQLGFSNVLITQWVAGTVMFLVGFIAMSVPVFISINVAFRARPMYVKLNSQLDRYQQVIEPLRRLAMWGIPGVLGLFAGVAASSQWALVLQWLNGAPSGQTDPQFGFDNSFYLFALPFYQSAAAFASAVVLLSGIAALATCYLYGALRISGREVRISKAARIQLASTAAIYLAIQAVSIWLDQYTTMFTSSSGLLVGASYADDNALIPARAILAGAAAIVALLFVVTAVIGRWRFPLVGTALLLASGVLIGSLFPFIVQRFQVDPSERTIEAPYLERNIEGTRFAYGVDGIQEQGFNPVTTAEAGALRNDAETTASIRIIDPALVSETFAQLQAFRQYYQFTPTLDVDRYEIDGEIQDTVVAVRELNMNNVGGTNPFYNRTFVFTHGYGIVAAYGNQRSVEGQPVFLQSGIPNSGILGTDFEPRIYFGESSPQFSIVGAPEGARPIELDYPAGEEEGSADNEVYTYTGDGGPTLNNVFKRLLYAIKFQSEQIFLSDAVNEASQILYDRDPRDRVQKVAPYLTLDSDAYPSVVDGRIVWIVDGYTTSNTFPYSFTQPLSQAIVDTYTPAPTYAIDEINYIRNSVKATVDAYTGEVTLYAWDAEDPILQTWQNIFPTTVTPMSEMSGDLMSHVRYPADLFKVQRAVLGTYHVTETDSFYSSDDAWMPPADPTQPPATAEAQPPYYLTNQVPGADEPNYSIYTNFIPQSGRNVLTGYLSANSNAGNVAGERSEEYGTLSLLNLPRSETVSGPGQVQNDFNSDTQVANQLALLQRGNTEVRLGNLLTLPVGGGLLYVQPVYVQSTAETSFPILRKVLVSFGNQIAFEDTLDIALDVIFGGDSGANAGDEGIPALPDGEVLDPEAPDLDDLDGGDTGDETPATPSPSPTPPTAGGNTGNVALDAALADAQQALADRTAAYAANDLVAAAQADQDLQDALSRALSASP